MISTWKPKEERKDSVRQGNEQTTDKGMRYLPQTDFDTISIGKILLKGMPNEGKKT